MKALNRAGFSALFFTIVATLSPSTVVACAAPSQMVFACDLVARPQRVEVCARTDADGSQLKTYSYGIPGVAQELAFSTTDTWGAVFHDGFVDITDLTQFGIGLVHDNGSVYMVYAFGDYSDGQIRRGLLQVFPSLDVFHQVTGAGRSGGAVFHAECQPATILGDFDFFAP